MEKKISVIIPCYNVTKYLPKCFLSLVRQTIGIDALELIFVNDASTDDGATWEMLLEFERAYPESIAIIDLPENRRQGGARNEGMKYATGEYLAFVDADDWVELDIYEKAYAKAKEYDADIVQFHHKLYFDSVGEVLTKDAMSDAFYAIQTEEERKSFLVQERLTYGCWNKLYRRSMVCDAGVQYAEHVIYEEPLFVYPLLFYANRIVTMSDRLYVYRQNLSGTMRKDMKAVETLLQHGMVQLAVWNFMKTTPFMKAYYEEIKLYFLHTYLYETLDFAKRRDFSIPYEEFIKMAELAKKEVADITFSAYEKVIAKQLELYRLIEKGLTEKDLEKYILSM